MQQRRTIILLRDTAEELMTALFDLQLTNQQKGVLKIRPRVEIEYSSFLEKKMKKQKRSHFLIFLLSLLNQTNY